MGNANSSVRNTVRFALEYPLRMQWVFHLSELE